MNNSPNFALGLLIAAMVLGSSAQAQAPNIENLKQMKVSGVDPSMPPVPQEGKNANQLRENLKRIKLPARLQDRPLCGSA